MTADDIIKYGYFWPKRLKTGEWACIGQFIFTAGLIVGVDWDGIQKKFCYESFLEAVMALQSWEGEGDPPGNWIKEKGVDGERNNPRTFKGVPIVTQARP